MTTTIIYIKCQDCGNDIKGDYRFSVDGERFICDNCYEIDRMMYQDGIYGQWTAEGRCVDINPHRKEGLP